MEEETKKEPVEPKEDGWAEKAKKLIDKAENYVEDKIEDIRTTTAEKLEDLAEGIRKKPKEQNRPEEPSGNPQK